MWGVGSAVIPSSPFSLFIFISSLQLKTMLLNPRNPLLGIQRRDQKRLSNLRPSNRRNRSVEQGGDARHTSSTRQNDYAWLGEFPLHGEVGSGDKTVKQLRAHALRDRERRFRGDRSR